MFFKRLLQTRWTRKRHAAIVFGLFIPLFFAAYLIKIEPTLTPDGDAKYYLIGAYNLMQYDIYSGRQDTTPPEPDSYRPPAYSWFLSQGMQLLPMLRDADYGWFTSHGKLPLDPAFVWLKYLQLLLLLATALLTAWLVWDLTRNFAYAHWCLWIMAFHPVLHSYVQRFYSELFGTFLITCFTALFYFALKKRSALLFGLTGLMLGVLTLTFAQWKYVLPCGTLAVALFGLLDKKSRWRLLLGAVLLAVGFQCVLLPWQHRNETLLGRNYVSSRGGGILLLRAYYDIMDWDAYASSFLYWSYGLPKYLLKEFVDREHYAYLDREDPAGAIGLTRIEKAQLREVSGGNDAAFDKLLMDTAINRILEHPVRHLLVSIPIAYRSFQDPTFSTFNLIVYFFFFYAFFVSLRRKDFPTVCLLVPPVALIAFNALATHGLPRYCWQLIPVVWLGAFQGFDIWLHKRKQTPAEFPSGKHE